MIKEIAWDTFKKTGDINTFLELKQIEVVEKEIETNLEVLKLDETKNNFYKSDTNIMKGRN